ncbi:MAG TPA: response regulator [Chloroflexota bacterium]|nr:response regulator [Chloroflexota bacterium]
MDDRDLSAGNGGLSPQDTANSAWAITQSPEPFLVLIVDDEAPIAETLSFIVEDAGYAPLTAAHGAEALELVRRRWPALVFTDLMMPHLNGARLIAALRDEAASTGQPPPVTVLMTAAGPRQAAEAGADAVLLKPFDLQDVEALLQRYLGLPPGA